MSWFGLQPPADAQASYGCRAILGGRHPNQSVDIVWDRQQFSDGQVPEAFVKWCSDQLSKWLDSGSRSRGIGYVDPAGDEVFTLDDEPFHAKACANRSHGYLYVVAWTKP